MLFFSLEVLNLDCRDCEIHLYDVRLITSGSIFFRDFRTSENKTLIIQECSFIFKNLGADTGWEIISKKSAIFIIKSFFHFESELNIRFKYFLKSSADQFKFIFESSKLNLRNFDNCFHIINTKNTSILFTNLKIEDFKFQGSFIYFLEDEYLSEESEAMNMTFENSQIFIHEHSSNFIILATRLAFLLFKN